MRQEQIDRLREIAGERGQDRVDIAPLEKQANDILARFGLPPSALNPDQGKRLIHTLYDQLAGYRADPLQIVADALLSVENEHSGLVVVRKISFYSMCEHDILPFFGHVTVAYLPGRHLIGLSRIARIVDLFARRLQIQERMTGQIADFLVAALEPEGVGVLVNAMHLCQSMRGVQKDEARLTTMELRGLLREDDRYRMQFLALVDSPMP